ncbi:hypothetical protein [Candidatus Poriferisocius sp.]|uniref:hypothetical protein n=1 Tax=Candidatus Poriferisocius sp. TaxID=3101276 RepID=UPI003B013577
MNLPRAPRTRLIALAIAVALGAAACGDSTAPPTATPATTAPTEAPAPAAESAPQTEAPAPASDLPSVDVVDLATGDTVNLAGFAPSDRPIVLWFWAPH